MWLLAPRHHGKGVVASEPQRAVMVTLITPDLLELMLGQSVVFGTRSPFSLLWAGMVGPDQMQVPRKPRGQPQAHWPSRAGRRERPVLLLPWGLSGPAPWGQ